MSITNGQTRFMDKRGDELEPYVEQLRRLPFVKNVRVLSNSKQRAADEFDATVAITTSLGRTRLPVELKRSHLSRDVAEHLLTVANRSPGLLVLAPIVGPRLGELFANARVNFMDLAGNCHVRIGDKFLARVQGQRATTRKPADRSLRTPAYRVLFALLADPELVHATTRTLAERSGGVSPQTAADIREKLIGLGAMAKARSGLRWMPDGRKLTLDMFLVASSHLLPGFAIGRFRAKQREAELIEADLAPQLEALAPGEWRWGGGAAAQRLTGHYRGNLTVIYLLNDNATVLKKLPLIPDPGGNVILMRAIGPLAFSAIHPECVHPLLVYADLLAEGHARAREAASELFERYLVSEQPPL